MLQEFVQSMSKMVDSKINEIHTTIPGKIISYDTETGLATVLPIMKFKMKDGSTVPYPQITGVPVLFPQSNGQQITIAYPIKPDDGCLVFIAEHSIEYWLYGQETDTDLSFDLTDAFCIPGLFATANPVVKKACNENAVIIDVKGTQLTVGKDTVKIDAKSVVINGDLQVGGEISSGTTPA